MADKKVRLHLRVTPKEKAELEAIQEQEGLDSLNGTVRSLLEKQNTKEPEFKLYKHKDRVVFAHGPMVVFRSTSGWEHSVRASDIGALELEMDTSAREYRIVVRVNGGPDRDITFNPRSHAYDDRKQEFSEFSHIVRCAIADALN